MTTAYAETKRRDRLLQCNRMINYDHAALNKLPLWTIMEHEEETAREEILRIRPDARPEKFLYEWTRERLGEECARILMLRASVLVPST